MDDEIRKAILTVLRLLLMQREKISALSCRVEALQLIAGRSSGFDSEQTEIVVQRLVAQLPPEAGQEELRQVEAIIHLLEKGRNPNIQDA